MSDNGVKASGTEDPSQDLKEMIIQRRELVAKDFEIKILFCGVCHSDLHTARNEWGGTMYPNVPGHEVVGRVIRIGCGVKKYKVGDVVGWGVWLIVAGNVRAARKDWSNIATQVISKHITATINI